LPLGEGSRRQLVEYLLESPGNALRVHGEEPELVAEAAMDDVFLGALQRDPVLFCHAVLGFRPTGYQTAFLRSGSKRRLLRWPRQSGKTEVLAVYALWHSIFHQDSTTLIIAPSRRQSMMLSDTVHALLNRMPRRIREATLGRALRTVIYLRNGSRLVSLPNSLNRIRGYTADLVIADEAAFFGNDVELFRHVLPPMMATTDGDMVVSSTPWGRDTVYYRLSQDESWEEHHITWRDAAEEGLYKPGFLLDLECTRESMPLTYRMEYLAEFTEEGTTWLTQDLLARAVDHSLEYSSFWSMEEGWIYLGVDVGERVDYTVITALRWRGGHLDLIHLKRFPLGSALAGVIGYIKTLSDRWRRVARVLLDSTRHGDYLISDLRTAGVPTAKGMVFTQRSKQEMAQILKRRLQEGTLHLPYDRVLLEELNVEQYQLTKTGRIALDHPRGTHDDAFWSLALATYAAEESPPSKPIAKTT